MCHYCQITFILNIVSIVSIGIDWLFGLGFGLRCCCWALVGLGLVVVWLGLCADLNLILSESDLTDSFFGSVLHLKVVSKYPREM